MTRWGEIPDERAQAFWDWYRQAFVCRFGPGCFVPHPSGPPLLGVRLRLQYEHPEDGWVTWECDENGHELKPKSREL